MRRTTPNRESREPKSQNRLNFVEPGEPGFEPETIARYRVALVREEATPYESPEHCGDPAAAARFLHTILSSWDREVMGALFLDTRNRAIGHQLAYIGTLTRAAVEPRGILTAALLANAAGILLFHNHPSGDPSPSAEDLAFSRRPCYHARREGDSSLRRALASSRALPGRGRSDRECGASGRLRAHRACSGHPRSARAFGIRARMWRDVPPLLLLHAGHRGPRGGCSTGSRR